MNKLYSIQNLWDSPGAEKSDRLDNNRKTTFSLNIDCFCLDLFKGKSSGRHFARYHKGNF